MLWGEPRRRDANLECAVVIHWPIAFTPGQGLFPPHPSVAGQVEIDDNVTLIDTWKAMLKLPKSKVCVHW